MNIEKGDIVILIDDNWNHHIPMNRPVRGVYYTVRDIGTHLSTTGSVGILLEEIRNRRHNLSGNEYCFRASRFKRIDIPKDVEEQVEEILKEYDKETEVILQSDMPSWLRQ